MAPTNLVHSGWTWKGHVRSKNIKKTKNDENIDKLNIPVSFDMNNIFYRNAKNKKWLHSQDLSI